MFPLKVCRVVLNKRNVAGKIKYASGYLTIGSQEKNISVSLSLSETKLLTCFSTSIVAGPSDFSRGQTFQPCPTSAGEFCVQKSSSNMRETVGDETWRCFSVYYIILH